jgi:hypothetical protein
MPEWARKWRGEQDSRRPTEVEDTEFGIATTGLEGEPQEPPAARNGRPRKPRKRKKS